METTTCYKCDTQIEALEGQVHPLCADCEKSFDNWFENTLAEMGMGNK